MAATCGLFALVWWGPGWLLGEALGLRRVLLPATAPAVGVGLLSVVGWVDRLAHVPWTLPRVLAQCAAIAAVVWLARRRTAAPRPDSAGAARRWWLAGLAGLVPAGLAARWVWVGGTAHLRAINQDWDMPWHANMVRLIAATAQWDPRLAGHFAGYDTTPGGRPMAAYPIALHAVLALVWPVTHVSIPVLFDVAVLALVAVQLPLSTMALTALVLPRPVAVAAAGAASTCLAVVPWDLLWRGPLIPYLAGLLLVGPFCLLAAHAAGTRNRWWLPAAALAGAGLVAVHPSLLAVAAPVLLFWWLARLLPWRRGAPTTGYLAVLLAVGALAALPVLLDLSGQAQHVAVSSWPPDTTPSGAVRDVLLLQHAGSPPMYAVAATAGLGALSLLLGRWTGGPRAAWYLPPVAFYALLSVATIGTRSTAVRRFSAPFYDDQWRIVAAYALLGLPLVGAGVWFLGRLVTAATSRGPLRTVGDRRLTVVAAVAALLVLAASLPALRTDQQRVSRQNKVVGRTLSAGEVRLLTEVSRWVPPAATVLNDACDGSVWMYALGDRTPMLRHVGVPPTQRQRLLLTSFRRISDDPSVRRAAAELGITFVYVADGWVRRWNHRPPGLLGLARLPFLTLVARDGDARLYRLDWSRLPGGEAQLVAAARHRSHRAGVPGTWSTADPSPTLPGRSVCG